MPSRNDLILAARKMIGTPFLHQGRSAKTDSNKGGLDCAGLGIAATKAIGLDIPDLLDYERRPDGKSLIRHLNKILLPIQISDALPGDIVIMYFVRSPQHIALLAKCNGRDTIIHASSLDGEVVEHVLNDAWKAKITRAYRVPGLD